jgi:hypothetical protein
MILFFDFFKIPEGVRVPFVGGILYRVVSALQRRYIRSLRIDKLSLNTLPREEMITVSLTSFPARIETVGYAIVSLFHQSMKPDRIVLWLADGQFPDKKMPLSLEQLQKKGLEIRFCDDLRSHKKYHYVLQEQQENELVITYDDDLIYPEDSIERLYKKHLQFPDCIVCNRAQTCEFEGDVLLPYNTWKVNSPIGVKEPSSRLFPSTGGGTLYPYGVVNKEAFYKENMKVCAWSADDLWMRFMSALNGTKIIKSKRFHKTFSVLENSQVESLQVENCIGGENDRAIKRLSEKYPSALEQIRQGR